MLVWMGDFNYRIDASYEHAKELAHRNQLTDLLAKVGCCRSLKRNLHVKHSFISGSSSEMLLQLLLKHN